MLLVAMLWAAPAHAEATCPDYAADPSLLVELEEDASRGALGQEEKDCLEKRYAAAAEQTTKDKISRVLLVNAYAYSTKYWSKLVQRHLDEVDRSDPDIAYLYAFHLFNTSPEKAEETIRWTEVALERRDAWTGNVYVSRVYGLMRLRALAATSMWQEAEERRAAGEAIPNAQIEDYRNKTKTYAREWVDFAKVAGRDTSEALAVCLSSANERACGVE